MEKLKGIVESPVQPNTTDVAWLKGNTLKHFSNGKWTEIGVPIVESVDKLDPNAKQGSLASVANTLREIKWSEVYQPTEDDLTLPWGDVAGKLTRITKFEVTPPTSMDIMPNDDELYRISFTQENNGGAFIISREGVVCMMLDFFDEDMMWASSDDGVNYNWNVYDEFVQQANKLLSENPMYYIESSLNDEPTSLPSFLDDILHIYTGEVSTELYIKTDKGWTPYKESDTVYIDYNALDEYDEVDYREDYHWYYEIPINEFHKVSRGVSFEELSKYRFVAFDGYVEPLMCYNNSFLSRYYTPTYTYGEDTIWYGQLLEIFADGDIVYVGYEIEYRVEMPCSSYDNVEYLPEDARVGTVASVRYEIEKETSVPISNTPTNSRLTKGIVIEAPQTVIVPNKSTVSIYFNAEPGAYRQRWWLGLTFSDSNVNIHWNGGSSAEPNHTIAVYNISSGSFSEFNQLELNNVNTRLTTPAIMGGYWWLYSKPSDEDIPYIDQFIKTSSMMNLIKCLIYTKNSSGWEQYSELVDQSVTTEKVADKAITLDKLSEDISTVIENCPIAVESVESLPSSVKIGTIASVLETTVEEKVLTGTVGPAGARVVRVEIEETTPTVMGSLEFILTTRDGKNIEIRSITTSGYPTNGHRLYFIDPNSNEFTLATFGSPYSNAEQNSENIETLNQLLQNDKYYGKQGYTQSEATAINDFFKELIIEEENINTKLYVKNTSGWEEYDKANKDKVAALESKVAELEAKIQELLQNQ